jgi:hypothetical protein
VAGIRSAPDRQCSRIRTEQLAGIDPAFGTSAEVGDTPMFGPVGAGIICFGQL